MTKLSKGKVSNSINLLYFQHILDVTNNFFHYSVTFNHVNVRMLQVINSAKEDN